MIICEGSTPTQVSALSDSAWDFAHRKAGEKPLSIDGAQRAEWIGMDYGTVLVHIFLPELREFYNLENLLVRCQSDSDCRPRLMTDLT